MSRARQGSGRQLSELLYLLGGGRAALPSGPEQSAEPQTRPRPGRVREVVAALGPRGAVQVDGTTCGSAALVVTAAAWDTDLARRLALPGAFDRAQTAVKRASTRHALAGLRWPGALGTPPWAAAHVARSGRLRLTHRLVVDSRPSQSGPLLDLAVAWARAGVPVPLYTGGDTRTGIATAVPRHVVVLTSPDGHALEVYEPGSGRLHPISEAELRSGGVRRPAYGGWSHITWVLLPESQVGPRR